MDLHGNNRRRLGTGQWPMESLSSSSYLGRRNGKIARNRDRVSKATRSARIGCWCARGSRLWWRHNPPKLACQYRLIKYESKSLAGRPSHSALKRWEACHSPCPAHGQKLTNNATRWRRAENDKRIIITDDPASWRKWKKPGGKFRIFPSPQIIGFVNQKSFSGFLACRRCCCCCNWRDPIYSAKKGNPVNLNRSRRVGKNQSQIEWAIAKH